MSVLLIAFVFSFLFYLALTAFSGGILIWSGGEIAAGILFSILVAILTDRLFSSLGITTSLEFFNPRRWFLFLIYVTGPFLWAMGKANLDVAYRVITGKINPGIVKIFPNLKTDLGITLLANSITLTPGTLSVDMDKENNLYVHCINITDKEPGIGDVCSNFHHWVKRITE